MKIHNFKYLQRYIEKNFLSVIKEDIAEYVHENSEMGIFKAESILDSEVEVTNCKILDMVVNTVIDHEFLIESKVGVDVVLSGTSSNEWEWDTILHIPRHIFFNVSMKTEFHKTLDNIYVVRIELMEPKEKLTNLGLETRELLPKIYNEKDADNFAEQFLREYYPFALATPTPIPIMEIIKKMGLKPKRGKLEDGKYGRCYFSDDYVRDKNGDKKLIQEGTVVYDSATDVTSRRRNNFTLAHEGAHWYCNNGYFARMRMLDPSFATMNYSGYDYTDFSGNYAQDIAIMEWQANALASRILMPACTARIKFEELVDDEIFNGETDYLKIYPAAIRKFAQSYDVTISAAKIRLLELGYYAVHGIFDYVDGHYTRNYLYNGPRIGGHQTIAVSFKSAVRLSSEDKRLRRLLSEGRVVYAENFFVLNDTKYVRRNKKTGIRELTDYALRHMDECCLVFNYSKGRSAASDSDFAYSYLNRGGLSKDKDGSKLRSNSVQNEDVLTRNINLDDEIAERQEALQIIKNMVGNFGEALKYLMEYKGFSCHSLMQESYVNEHKLSKYISGENTCPTKKDVLAICAAMELHPRVAHELLKRACIDISTSMYEEDLCYEFLLNQLWGEGLAAWNEHILSFERTEWVIP